MRLQLQRIALFSRKPAFMPLVFAVLSLTIAQSARAQGITYTVVNIPNSAETSLTAINDFGVAVGYYYDNPSGTYQGFIYNKGAITFIPAFTTGNIFPVAINNNGDVLINLNGTNGSNGAQVGPYFLYQGGGFSAIGIGVTAGGGAGLFTSITGLNDEGEVVGTIGGADGNSYAGYAIPEVAQGSMTPPDTMPYPTATTMMCPGSATPLYTGGINDQSAFTGVCLTVSLPSGQFIYQGFSYGQGVLTNITYPGSTNLAVLGLSNLNGLFAGYFEKSSLGSGFFFNGSTYTPLSPPNALSSVAYGVNSSGQIVGEYAGFYNGTDIHGFITSPMTSTGSLPQNAQMLGGCDCPGQVQVAKPIDVASGNMYEHFTDYTTSGQNPLAFKRYYNSRGNSAASVNTLATSLGVNWRSNYDRHLQLSPSSVTAERADGQQLAFALTGSKWGTASDVDVTLTHSGSIWTLTDRDDTVETYSAVSAKEARLTTITLRNGYFQDLAYNGSGELTSVSDTYGRSLEMAYTGNLLETVTTPDKTTLAFKYNAVSGGSQLVSVTYDTSPATSQTYHYDNSLVPFALTSITDENGKTFAQWTYDSDGRGLTSQLADEAEATSLEYNPDGTTTVTNALGVADTYTFTTLQGIPKVTTISRAATGSTVAATEMFSYDANGYQASQTDWNGNKTSYANNTHGLPTKITEAAGTGVTRTTTVAYDTKWVRLPATITTPGLTTGIKYDGFGEVLTRKLTDTTTTTAPYSTEGTTRTWTNTWTTNQLLASVETPNGNTTKFGYDSSGALISITDPLSHLTSITSHTGGGLPETIMDPNDVTTTLTYSPRQWLTSSAISGTGGTFTTSFTYDAVGNLTKTTLPDNSYIANAYDSAHRLIKVTDALGNYASYTLNALDDRTVANIYESGGTLTRKHSATFDDLGRALVETAGAGQTTTFTYDPDGDVLSVTDGLGHKNKNTYDALNRLSTSTDANGGVTTTTYDTHDRILSVKDANGNTTSYVRDGFGDVIQQTSPDSGTTVYHYDLDGNLTQKVDAAAVVTNHSYDALDRILTTTYPADAAENVKYTYDRTGHGSGIGRLTNVTDAVGTLSRSYDERGNLTSEKRVHGSVTFSTKYSYDGASRIASITYPSGTVVKYSRDAAGQVTKVATASATVVSAITHLPFGPVNSFTYGNGIADTRTFDDDYRMTALKDAASGSSSVQSLGYAYDVANNLNTITDNVRATNNQAITYDALNRLKSATSADYGTFTYTYDKVGNRLTEGRASEAPTNNYSYVAGTNRLSGITTAGIAAAAFTYTPTGNIVDFMGAGEPTVSLLYNKANRVGTIMENGTQVAQYTYDGFGQRLVKAFAGTPAAGTLFAYGQDGGLLEETNISGAAQADYIYLDGTPIGDLAPASKTLSYLHTDHLGTPQLATNIAKASVWAATYEPFGWGNSVTGTITQNLRLPGQSFDSETGSYHNGFRDYVAIFGIYGQADPAGLIGGINTYVYGSGNPVRFVDKRGLQAADVEPDEKDSRDENEPDLPEIQNEINLTRFTDAQNELRNIDPNNPNLTYVIPPGWTPSEEEAERAEENVIAARRCSNSNLASAQRINHILNGDETGGGHLYPGLPGKTPFPSSWDEPTIMEEVSDIATDPTLPRTVQPNGNTAVQGTVNGVNITVIVNPSGNDIISAFPTNLPRNPR